MAPNPQVSTVENKLAVVTTQSTKKITNLTQRWRHKTQEPRKYRRLPTFNFQIDSSWAMGMSKKNVGETKKSLKLLKPQISVPILRSCSKALYSSYGYFVLATRVADPDPDWIRIQSVCGSGSGSRRAKMTHKSRNFFVKVHVLKCWMASFEG
jgi:hypothetical protein